jgi:hypothetical protein
MATQATRPAHSALLLDLSVAASLGSSVGKGMDGGSTESGFPEWDWLSSSSSGLPPAFPGSSLPTSGEPSPMENGERSSAKRVRVPSPPGNRVKQEVPAWEEEASGGGETEAMDGAAARAEVVVRIDKEMLHCPICTLPLKPPIFQVCSTTSFSSINFQIHCSFLRYRRHGGKKN